MAWINAGRESRQCPPRAVKAYKKDNMFICLIINTFCRRRKKKHFYAITNNGVSPYDFFS